MSELITRPADVPSVPDVSDDLQIVARDAEEMATAQKQLEAWFNGKITVLKRDLKESHETAEAARRGGFVHKPFEKAASRIQKRIEYYEKCRDACAAGYVLVPNMPMTLFALRTNRNKPRTNWQSNWQSGWPERSDSPPSGEGRYVDDDSFTKRRETPFIGRDGKEHMKVERSPSRFDEEIDFPVSIAKPAIMTRTAEAMAVKCFDEIGVVDNQDGRGDPLVVGHIRDPRGNGRGATFLIAWFVDTAEL